MVNRRKYNLNNLLFQSNKNKNLLDKKINSNLIELPVNEFFSNQKLIYDSNWSICELEKIKSATSVEYETLLPERAKYNFSIELNIPESYLPFLKYNILTKTVPEQQVLGVGNFNFTSLSEISFRLYDWHGITYILAPGGDVGGWTDLPISGPSGPLPSPSLTIPPPEFLYENLVHWNKISAPLIGTGLGPYRLDSTGTYLIDWGISVGEWTQYIIDTYHTDYTQIIFSTTEDVGFLPPVFDFPVPIGVNPDFVLPGGIEDWSTEEFPSQYWLQEDITDFQGLVAIYGYTDAKDILETWYPINSIYITPEDSPPYNAYEVINTNQVKSCQQQIIINKLSKDNFRIDISGYILLLSKAITEAEWSDPQFPTYIPNGEDLFVRLKVNFTNPLTSIQLNNYKK